MALLFNRGFLEPRSYLKYPLYSVKLKYFSLEVFMNVLNKSFAKLKKLAQRLLYQKIDEQCYEMFDAKSIRFKNKICLKYIKDQNKLQIATSFSVLSDFLISVMIKNLL